MRILGADRAAVYNLLSPKSKRKTLTLHKQTGRETKRGGEGWGSTKTMYSKERS